MSVDVVVLSECEVNVGTEGHVDHGKTSRVKAMTPGAGGIDPAMLMVAADEGVMPQTREHVGICALLGVRWGVLVVMKAALLPGLGDGGLELLEGELCGLVAGTFREGGGAHPRERKDGRRLRRAQWRVGAAGDRALSVEPVHRAFSIKGFGCVVTGTVWSGRLSVSDEVASVPGPAEPVRLRAFAGERIAVNPVGVEAQEVARGMALVRLGEPIAMNQPSRRDGTLRTNTERPRPGFVCADLPPSAVRFLRRGGEPVRRLELDRIEGLGPHGLTVRERRELQPAPLLESVHFNRSREGVDEPQPLHTLAGVDARLRDAIDGGSRRSQNLEHPIRCQRQEGLRREHREPAALPASEIGNEGVCPQMKLGLVENPPAARRLGAPELRVDVCPRVRCGLRMRQGGPWEHQELTVDELTHHRLGNVGQVRDRR